MLTWRDVISYIRLFLRWWYVLLLAVLLSTGSAWYLLERQPNLYVSKATLMVGNNFAVAAPNGDAVRLSNVLASYYAAMVNREVILGPVAEQLQLPFPWELIRDRMLSVSIDQGANLLELMVLDTDPERGAALANAIADRLIAYTPSASKDAEVQQAELERQLKEAQDNIKSTEAKIADLEQRLKTLSSAIDISDLQKQLEALEKARDKYTSDYTNLLALRNQSSVNSLTLFEQARPSPQPVPKKTLLTLGAAAVGGLMLAVLAVLMLDKLDERWRTGGELQNRTGIKSLGEVPGEQPLAVAGGPAPHPRRERAVRDTYSNMVLAAKSELPRSLLVSSPQPSRARSSLAIDIADMYVRTGHRVMLVDAESHRSDMTELLEEEQRNGASSGDGRRPYGAAATPEGMSGIWRFVRPTGRPGVVLLSARDAGYDRFASLVPSVYWPDMMQHLHQVADVVIFDGPAALGGPDAGLLAPLVDGVLLVLDGKRDSRTAALRAKKQLVRQPSSHFLGAVVATGARGRRLADAGRQSPAGQDKGLRIVVGAKGITISFGAAEGGAAAGASSGGPRLLPVAEPAVMPTATVPREVEVEAQAVEVQEVGAPINWEDLLERERAATAAGQNPRGSWTVGDATRAVIITPPPPIPVVPLVPPPPAAARQRKARIANSRRASKAVR
jgi:capsular polysaccharide biosynthesis protein/Mrp family chromosome partitioning ATPase